MSDPIRQTTAGADEAAGQDAAIERLLLTGLDHYFSGRYERAIHVWTRVLFIDRGHTRARAYIERARGALAERQRESEELLHGGAAALDRGDVEQARDLLNSAVERGAPPEDALLYLGRLTRLEVPIVPPAGETARDQLLAPSHEWRPRPPGAAGTWLSGMALMIGVALLAGAAFYSSSLWPWQGPVSASIPAPEDPLPVPRHSEITLVQARALHDSGHLYESLRLLDRIRADDPLRSEADLLRARIQRALLDAHGVGQAPADGWGAVER